MQFSHSRWKKFLLHVNDAYVYCHRNPRRHRGCVPRARRQAHYPPGVKPMLRYQPADTPLIIAAILGLVWLGGFVVHLA